VIACNKPSEPTLPIMNLLQSAKREFYTIRQTLTEKNIIGKTAYLGVGGNSAVSTASYLPPDLFEIQSTKVAKLAELTDVLQTSVKSIQASFYNRTSTEAKLSSLIANEIFLENSVKRLEIQTDKNSSEHEKSVENTSKTESLQKSDAKSDSESTTNSVNNSPTTVQLETESNLLTETSFYENLLNNSQDFKNSPNHHPQKQTSTSLDPHQIPTWLDEKRKLELQSIPDHQQNLISKITLLKNSSLSKLLLLKSQTSSERTRYHAMLHWMHDTTDNLNPEDSGELEKFKNVQQEVRTQKLKFENRTHELVKQLDFVEKELDFFVNEEICVGLGVVEGRFEPVGDGRTEICFEDVHQLCLEKSKNQD